MKNVKKSSEKNVRRKPISKAVLCSVCTAMLVSTCGNSIVLANQIKNPKRVVENQSFGNKKEPLGSLADLAIKEESETVDKAGDGEPILTTPSFLKATDVESYSVERISAKYTMAELAQMPYDQMIDIVCNLDSFRQITDLFVYNDGNQAFYGDKQRVQALIDNIKSKAPTYTSTDNKGIPTLIEVLRSGYYLGFYNPGLSYLKTREEKSKVIPAIKALQANSNFRFGTSKNDEMVAAVGSLIWNSATDVEVINNCIPIVRDFVDNFDIHSLDNAKGTAFYNIIGSIEYDISSYKYEGSTDYTKSQWYGKIDNYIEQVIRVANLGPSKLNSNTAWIINNGIYMMGTLGKVHSDPKRCHQVLTDCLSLYEYLGEQYFEVINVLSYNYDSKDVNGNLLDKDKIIEAGKQKYLPKKYSFDNGSVQFQTGDKVTEEKVQRLYWALKEVKSQLFRVIGRDNPLEQGNADDVLTVVIYNSPKEYKFNKIFNNLSVDNGGMYIEGDGTFYTYERTIEESYLSLEELFRHELTHYLQGRYMVPGMWGSGALYENGRLNWYEEGGAELFAGSTRYDGVKVRKTMIGTLRVDPSARWSLSKTLNATYDSGWDMYNYAWAFQNYLYENRKDLYDELISKIMNNDVAGYDALRSKWSNDSALNAEYQKHMQKLVDNYNSYDVPMVSDAYLATIQERDLNGIVQELNSVANLSNGVTTTQKSHFDNAFTFRGTYVGEKSQGKLTDQAAMDKVVNNNLKTLDTHSWNGFKTLTAYYVNHRVDNNGNFVFDVVYTGKLPKNIVVEQPIAPVAKIVAPSSAKVNTNIEFKGDSSTDDKGITSYAWNFGDGTTSTEVNPTHSFAKPGKFTVTLTVKDTEGLENTITQVVTVTQDATNGITSEVEPNNNYADANGPIFAGTQVSGEFAKSNDNDYYYFEVKEEGPVEIKVTTSGMTPDDMNWIVYAENDLNNLYAWKQDSTGNSAVGTFNAKPGKYYLVNYNWDKSGSYTIDITGKVGDGTVTPENQAPTAVIVAPTTANVGESVSFNGAQSSDADGTIVGYSWNFGDGSTSTQVNPSHSFSSAGIYDVSLTVTDDKGLTDTLTHTIEVKDTQVPGTNVEVEPNNSESQANGPIKLGELISGSLDTLSEDYTDKFYFEVSKKTTLNFTIQSEGTEYTWNITDEDGNSVAYPKGEGKDEFTVNPGKYYVTIYTWGNKNIDYTFKIDNNQGGVDEADKKAAEGVINKINALPDRITLEDKKDVEEA
ncbi:microbial collagenase, partial [Clostridium collagenovorans DSM 3089]